MVVDFEQFEIGSSTSTRQSNFKYRSTALRGPDFEFDNKRDFLCATAADESQQSCYQDTESSENSKWLLEEAIVEPISNKVKPTEKNWESILNELDPIRNTELATSYTNDEELKLVFAQLDAATLSTSGSEITLDSTRGGYQRGKNHEWDVQGWKQYLETNKHSGNLTGRQYGRFGTDEQSEGIDQASDRDQYKIDRKNMFRQLQFNRKILKRMKQKRENKKAEEESKASDYPDECSIDSDGTLCDELRDEKGEGSNKRTPSQYEDYDSWLFSNCTIEEIEKYRQDVRLKRKFAPAALSNRQSDRLNHTEVHKANNLATFEKLPFQFKPHMKFPKFGEGRYTTTAVMKNYTFKTTEQMAINRANYILDQRLKKLKTRKSNLTKPAQPVVKIRFDQSSSYINRMKEYERIHKENQKMAKKFTPSNIRNTYNFRKKNSEMSLSISQMGMSKSKSSFCSKVYTTSYDKSTVVSLAHGKNQYAPGKQNKRPDWDVGHVDYKKSDVKPVPYKSIRKLAPSVITSSVSSQVTRRLGNGINSVNTSSVGRKVTNGLMANNKPGAPNKQQTTKKPLPTNQLKKSQTSLLAKNKVTNNDSRKTNGYNRTEKGNNTKDSQKTNGYRQVNNTETIINNMTQTTRLVGKQTKSSSMSNLAQKNGIKSRIPVRRRDLDLDDTKFDVFRKRNQELFGSLSAERKPNGKTNRTRTRESNEHMFAYEETLVKGTNVEIGAGDVKKRNEKNDEKLTDMIDSDHDGDGDNRGSHWYSGTMYEQHVDPYGNEYSDDNSLDNIEEYETEETWLIPSKVFPQPMSFEIQHSFVNALDVISERTESDTESLREQINNCNGTNSPWKNSNGHTNLQSMAYSLREDLNHDPLANIDSKAKYSSGFFSMYTDQDHTSDDLTFESNQSPTENQFDFENPFNATPQASSVPKNIFACVKASPCQK